MLRGDLARCLFFRDLSSHVQAVKVEHCVEHQRIAAYGLGAIDGIRGKQNHVSVSYRHVNHGCMLCDFTPAFYQP